MVTIFVNALNTSQNGDVVADFADLAGVSPSGARVLFFGLVDRCSEEVLQKIVFVNVKSDIVPVLETAVHDTLDSLSRKSPTTKP